MCSDKNEDRPVNKTTILKTIILLYTFLIMLKSFR